MKELVVSQETLLEIMNHQLKVIGNKDGVIEQKDKTIADLQQNWIIFFAKSLPLHLKSFLLINHRYFKLKLWLQDFLHGGF